MKKIFLLVLVCMYTMIVSAQSIIYFKDGTIANVKIVYEDSLVVKYKLLSNPSGPTWVKSKENIMSISKHEELLQQNGDTLDFTSCDGQKKNKVKNCPSGKPIVSAIDSLYDNDNRGTTAAWRDIPKYVGSLPSCIQEKCIHSYFLNRFKGSCLTEDPFRIIRDGEIYLYLGADEERAEVISIVAKMYAREENEVNAYGWISKLEDYSKENDNLFDNEVEQLRKEVYDILHPYRWEDEIKGKWVMLNNVKNESVTELENPLILEIKSVEKTDGARLLEPGQRIPRQKSTTADSESFYTKQINISQGLFFDGDNNYAVMQFGTMSVWDARWMTGIVNSTLDINRDTQSKMQATIYSYSSKVPIEEQFAASLATELTFATLNAIVKNLNTSFKSDRVYNIVLYPQNHNVMNSLVSFVDATTKTTAAETPTTIYHKYIKDKKTHMVRWEESDSVYFVSKNKKIISLTPMSLDDPLFQKYHAIKRKHSLLNPAYFIPMVAGNILGCIMIKKGIDYNYAQYYRDSNGNRIPNGLGGYMVDEKTSNKAFLFLIGGGVACITTITAVVTIMKTSREKAFIDLNRRNIEKLRRKTAVSVSMAPQYDVYHDSFGANINISF